MAALFQLIPTSPELLQHDPLSILADLLILFCDTKLTFNGPLVTPCGDELSFPANMAA